MKITVQGGEAEVARTDVLLLQSHAGYDVRVIAAMEAPPRSDDGVLDVRSVRWRGELAMFRAGDYCRPIARAPQLRGDLVGAIADARAMCVCLRSVPPAGAEEVRKPCLN
jgi:hypothetical protein